MTKLDQLKTKLAGRVYHSTGNLIAFIMNGQPHTVIAQPNDNDKGDPSDDVLILSGNKVGGKPFKSKDVDEVYNFIQF